MKGGFLLLIQKLTSNANFKYLWLAFGISTIQATMRRGGEHGLKDFSRNTRPCVNFTMCFPAVVVDFAGA
jgi:hypothetical protein